MKLRYSLMITFIALLSFSMFALSNAASEECSRASVNEGTITISPAEEEQVTGEGYPVKTAVPGDNLIFHLRVNNSASVEQMAVMELIGPEGWHASVTGSVPIPGGESREILLAVDVPLDLRMDPTDDYTFRVDAVGNLTGDRGFILVIVRLEAGLDHELVLLPDSSKEMDLRVFPGQNMYIDVLLRNQGDILDDYQLRIMEHQTDWDIRFMEGEGDLHITLPPGETGSIFRTELLVNVPSTTSPGFSRNIVLRSFSNLSAIYEEGKETDSVTIHFTVVNPSTMTIRPAETYIETESGENTPIEFDIVVTGVSDATFEPSLEILSGSFSQSGWLWSVDLEGPSVFSAGDTRRITVNILPPSAISGEFDIILGGTSDSADVIKGKTTFLVTAKTNISFSDLVVSDTKMGEDVIISFHIRNSGDSSQQVVLDVEELPSVFIPAMDPSSFVIGPGSSRQVDLILYPRTERPPLEFSFKINIKVPLDDKGEWLVMSELDVPVAIKELPNTVVYSIELPDRPLDEGESVPVNITIENPSNMAAVGWTLEVYELTWSYSNVIIDSFHVDLGPGERETIEMNWTARPSARKIRALLVGPEGSDEICLEDNDLSEPVNVRPAKSGIVSGNDAQEGGYIPAEYAVAAVAGGSILLTSILLFFNTDYVRYPLFAGLYPLYTKLKPEHLLSNRLRRRIYVYVQNNPGEHFRSILVNLNLTNGTLAHHLYTLEKENLIRSQRDGLYRRFYPAGYHIEEDKVNLSPLQKRILELVESRPGLSQKDISLGLGISNSTVNYNVKSMKEKKVIEVRKMGKSTHIYPISTENS